MHKQQLHQRLKLKQVISQQTIQLMKLIELSNNSLEQEILKEVEENPALEIDREEEIYNDTEKQPGDLDIIKEEKNLEDEELNVDTMFDEQNIEEYYSSDNYDSYSSDESDYLLDNPKDSEKKSFDPYIVSAPSFHEYLIQQLQDFSLSEEDQLLAQYLIGYIDDTGYLTIDLSTIATDFLLSYNIFKTEKDLETILTSVIHQLEPDGVGARSLQESLLIQLDKKEYSVEIKKATEIINHYFDEFTKKQYEKISKKLKINKQELTEILNIITHLNPKPIFQLVSQDSNLQDITPDFIITNENGKLSLQLNNPFLPKIQISKEFQNTFSRYNKKLSIQQKEEAEKFIKENIEHANQFINSLNLREMVLYNTMYSIMEMQKKYFLSGDEKEIKPMVLKYIAEKVNLDISTISRVSNSKYVQTPFGTISLKHLFSESVGDENTSSKEVKQIIKEIIEREDENKPLQDEEIREILSLKGYTIARRTVSKYRKQLNIPVARLRITV